MSSSIVFSFCVIKLYCFVLFVVVSGLFFHRYDCENVVCTCVSLFCFFFYKVELSSTAGGVSSRVAYCNFAIFLMNMCAGVCC
jgi:hypothetical protein